MDLGISSLTDDQLLELLQQSCAELSVRDGYVRDLAQKTIVSEAEKHKLAREALEMAAKTVKNEYVRDLNNWVLKEVRQDVKNGLIRLHPVEEEDLIIKAELDARQNIIAEAKASIVNQKQGVTISINGEMITLSSPLHNVQAKLPLDPAVVSQLALDLAAALGTYPKFKFNAQSETKIVNSRAEEVALGEDWKDSPAAFAAAPTPPPQPDLTSCVIELRNGQDRATMITQATIVSASVRTNVTNASQLVLLSSSEFARLQGRTHGIPEVLLSERAASFPGLDLAFWPIPNRAVTVEIVLSGGPPSP